MLGVHRAVAVCWPPRTRAPSRSAPACEEDGSHEDLLGANGHYARLWNMQAWLLTGCGRTHGRVAESRADGRARGQIYDFCLSFNSGDSIPNWVGMASGRGALEMSIPFPAKNQRFRGQAIMETVNLF
jgi:hypothetical protein